MFSQVNLIAMIVSNIKVRYSTQKIENNDFKMYLYFFIC